MPMLPDPEELAKKIADSIDKSIEKVVRKLMLEKPIPVERRRLTTGKVITRPRYRLRPTYRRRYVGERWVR